MADNYLITGYWGEPHVTAENDRGINAAMFGTGRFVLPVGEQFKAEYIGNNTVRVYDGKLMDNGAAAGIPVGEYVDLLISNAGQGMKRNDLIVFQYAQDASTLIESGTFVVIQGEETTGTASDPALEQEDLLSGTATFDQFALWRVAVSGTTISAPVQVFDVYQGGGGNSMELLWENASPTSAFAAQTVALDLADFAGVFIYYKNQSTGSVYYSTGFIGKGDEFTLVYTPSVASTVAVARKGSVSATGVTFADTSNSTAYDVPVKIYGVRGAIA